MSSSSNIHQLSSSQSFANFIQLKVTCQIHRFVLIRLVICIESTLIMGDKMAESVKPCQNVVRPILKRDV